jgi:hypothetical protein
LLASRAGLSGPVGVQRAHQIINAYSLAFFDRHLKGRPAALLDGPAEQYPEGGYVVRLSGKLYEALTALAEHRPRLDLYHSALQIWLPEDRFVIECAAILNLRGEERGVVAGGPVGMSWRARSGALRPDTRVGSGRAANR